MASAMQDFGDRPVPEGRRSAAMRIGVTTGAWIIAMSTFFTGGVLANGMSFGAMAAAAVLGQAMLGFVGFLTALAGARARVSTAMLAREVYGVAGGRVIALLVGLVLGVGWFAWQLSFFGQTIATAFGGTAFTTPGMTMLWGAVVTTVSVLFGFRLLSFVSAFAVPAILALSFYGLSLSIGRAGGIGTLVSAHGAGQALPMLAAIGLVIGNGIVGTVMFPDLSRFARHPVAGAAAAAIGYAAAGTVILLCGAAIVLAARAAPGDLPGAMAAVGMGVPAFIVLIVAQWATNKGNLYSGALSLVAATGLDQKLATVLLGMCGLAMALAGIQDRFVPLLTFLGAFMPPIAAGLVVQKLLFVRSAPAGPIGLVAVLVGGVAGYLAPLTGVALPAPFVAFIMGGLAHALLVRMAAARSGPR